MERLEYCRNYFNRNYFNKKSPMQNLSELQDYYNRKRSNVIIYSDVNNPLEQRLAEDTVRTCMKFDQILFLYNPNRIILKSGYGEIHFNFVVGVHIEEDQSILGDIVSVHCHNYERPTSYTLIMRQDTGSVCCLKVEYDYTTKHCGR